MVDHILYNELEISHGVNQQSSSIDNNDIDMLSQDENIDSNDIDNHQEDVQIHDDSKWFSDKEKLNAIKLVYQFPLAVVVQAVNIASSQYKLPPARRV